MAFLAALPGAIGGAFGGLGGVLSTVGSVVGIASSLAQANYQAKVAQNNAKIAEENAGRANAQASAEQQQSDMEAAAFLGQQEAVQSASGLDVNGRTQMLTRRKTRGIFRQDAANIIEGGRSEGANYLQQAADYRGQAKQAKAAGIMNAVGGGIQLATSLVGGSKQTSGGTTAARLRNNRIPLPNGRYTTWRMT